ncbi:hypothetical protein TSUD_197910 [Trifolium subterraneum]|uniref:Uncharacterized protein n=1 Tax=Trifolium subterraneum TaxID=3900 RepID=A0A2Z6LJY4_TRISU|nr:hypothetical protein TSUD_197910 [Trifolium subterraneum]
MTSIIMSRHLKRSLESTRSLNLSSMLSDDTALDAIEGADSTNNEEIVVLNPTQTPTSKGFTKKTLKDTNTDNNEEIVVLDNSLAKRSLNLDEIGASATRESPIPDECASLLTSAEPPTCKPVGKRSAILDANDVSAMKETKIACVKIENTK